jgi:putative ABC transport system permease protein
MRDLRYAVRFLWAHKSFSAAAVITLAIGLGANTALYGLLSTALRPLPLPDADRLVAIAAETRDDDTGGFQYSFSIDAMTDLQARADAFSAIVGIMPRIGGLSTGGRAAQFWFAAVSDNYFSGLGVTPEAGTLFAGPSGSPVHVVLGHTFWMQTFGGDPSVIGRTVRVDGAPAVVSGVVAKSFRGTLMGVELDGYVALDDYGLLSPDARRWLYHNRKARSLQLFARLRPGVSVAEAQASIDVVMRGLEAEHADSERGIGARVIPEPLARPLPMRAVSDAIPLVQFFGLAVAGLVLLLACMNVANLLLVRASARQREMAVRAALGASRGRLVRQMVTEGLLLSGIGGAAGYGVGQWFAAAYLSRIDLGADIPLRFDVSFDLDVFLFSFGAALATGVAIGLWPAWRASRADARAALHDGGKGQSDGADRQRLRRLLVIGQISGALALLVVAGLFVRTLSSAQRIDLGFDADRLISVRVDPRQIDYDEDRTNDLYDELQRRVAAWPDVESVAVAFSTPMSYLIGGGSIFIEGQPLPASGQPPASFINHVGRNYFRTMGIPIVRGRAFVEDDERQHATTRRLAIVNETMAARYWPGQDPIGKRFQAYNQSEPMLEVVGVARDSKYVLVFEAPRPYVYLPIVRDMSLRTLIVRAAGDPAPLAPRLEQEIRTLAPDLPMADLRTMEQSLAGMFGYLIFRVGAIQAGGMGLLGLALAIVGVYGVVSFGASLRTREIGIRTALGAQPRDVLRLIVGQGLQLVAIGILIGLACAVALSRVLSRFLPLVNAADWPAFAAIAIGLTALALAACYIPARRATRVPVMTALRHE